MSQKVTLLDAAEFVTGSDSELCDLSDDESDENHILSRQMDIEDSADLSSDSEENDTPLANIAQSNNGQSTSTRGNPPSEDTAGEKLILLHTEITSKGCFQIPRMKFQLHCSIFTKFLLMKH